MAHKNPCILLVSLLILSSIVLQTDQTVTALYLLGDGLLDVGNNYYFKNVLFKANFPPNGIDRKNIENTRFSNGRNYADFLAEKVGLETSPAYSPFVKLYNLSVPFPLSGVNFALGGAGILKDTDDPLLFSKQFYCFYVVYEQLEEKLGSATAQIIHLSKSLFIVAIGTNDIINYYKSGSDIPHKSKPEDYVGSMLSAHEDVLKNMYLYGASKYVVIGIGPVGCVPFLRSQNHDRYCNEKANLMARDFNEGLKTMLRKLSLEHKGFCYSYIDEYNVVWDFIHRPTEFGFRVVTVGCCKPGSNIHPEMPCEPFSIPCSNRNDILFWDQYHLTEAATESYINLVFEGSEPYVLPINIKQLIEA